MSAAVASRSPEAPIARELTCPLCGHLFAEAEMPCHDGCPLARNCQVLCCPRCGYELVDTRAVRDRFARLGSLFARCGSPFARSGSLFARPGSPFTRTGSLFAAFGSLRARLGSSFTRGGPLPALFRRRRSR